MVGIAVPLYACCILKLDILELIVPLFIVQVFRVKDYSEIAFDLGADNSEVSFRHLDMVDMFNFSILSRVSL